MTSAEERDSLLIEHLPQVRAIAVRLYRHLPSHVLFEDLVQTGILGLLQALQRFDGRRGTRLHLYARFRIRGAMVDFLRQADWGPRKLRRDQRRLEKTKSRLCQLHGSRPDEHSLAREFGLSLTKFHNLVRDIHASQVQSLTTEECLALDDTRNPLCKLIGSEMRDGLKEAVLRLPARERKVVELRYFGELKMKDIGELLGINESRVSQIHSSAIRKLRHGFEVTRSDR